MSWNPASDDAPIDRTGESDGFAEAGGIMTSPYNSRLLSVISHVPGRRRARPRGVANDAVRHGQPRRARRLHRELAVAPDRRSRAPQSWVRAGEFGDLRVRRVERGRLCMVDRRL